MIKYVCKKYKDHQLAYGLNFWNWCNEIYLTNEYQPPYYSYGNGSAMRVSPCAWVADSLEEAQDLAYKSAAVTHNHPEGIKGALATVDAIYLARIGASKDEIKDHVETRYGYDLDRTVDEIRPYYSFDVSSAGSVPESIICFLEADDYEDTIRTTVSLGGDADTQAAIAGGIASAFWDVPESIVDNSVNRLDDLLLGVLVEFEDRFM